jgi:hypothetical protein
MIETIIICGTVLAVAGMVYRFMNRVLDEQSDDHDSIEFDPTELNNKIDALTSEFDAIKLTLSMRNGR